MQLFWTQFNTEMLTFTLLNNISISKFILMTAYYIFSSQSKTGEICSHIGPVQPISASKTPDFPYFNHYDSSNILYIFACNIFTNGRKKRS